jgi:hypothetical protein
MSRIKVIVKGKVTSGHRRVAQAIRGFLEGAGANVVVESHPDPLERPSTVFHGMDFQVKLKVVQEPRVKPVATPEEETRPGHNGTLWTNLSEEEWRFVRVQRGQKLTGYPVHQDKEGRHYFWSWGHQPDGAVLDAIADACPAIAAHKFLARYEPCEPKYSGSCIQPVRAHKKPSPTLALEADL